MNCAKLLADIVGIDTKFYKYIEDMQARTDLVQVCLNKEVKCVIALDSDRVNLLVSEKSLKHPLQLRSDKIQEVEDLKYRLDGVFANERLSETINKSCREQLLSVRFDVENQCQRLAVYTESFTAELTDGFGGLQ